jgi:hypothetical protein
MSVVSKMKTTMTSDAFKSTKRATEKLKSSEKNTINNLP